MRKILVLVFLPTMVTEADGRLVPDLQKDDFTVLDNGKPQELAVFESSTQPFTAVVALDAGGAADDHRGAGHDAARFVLDHAGNRRRLGAGGGGDEREEDKKQDLSHARNIA